MNLLGIGVLILIAFTIGYKVIGWLFDRVKKPQPTAESAAGDASGSGPRWGPGFGHGNPGATQGSADADRTRIYEDPETRYARVLGLPRNFTVPEIKERYRTLIAIKAAQELPCAWMPTTDPRRASTIDCAVSEMMQPRPGLQSRTKTSEGEN